MFIVKNTFTEATADSSSHTVNPVLNKTGLPGCLHSSCSVSLSHTKYTDFMQQGLKIL